MTAGAPESPPIHPFAIRVGMRADRHVPREHLRLQLDPFNARRALVQLSTDFDPPASDRADLEGGAVIVCHVDHLPLKPGTYVISATLERAGGDIIDRVANQALFVIVPADFYGTGVVAGETHPAPLLVRHHWDVLPAEATAVAGALNEAIG
jgi:hypothetical protein